VIPPPPGRFQPFRSVCYSAIVDLERDRQARTALHTRPTDHKLAHSRIKLRGQGHYSPRIAQRARSVYNRDFPRPLMQSAFPRDRASRVCLPRLRNVRRKSKDRYSVIARLPP